MDAPDYCLTTISQNRREPVVFTGSRRFQKVWDTLLNTLKPV